MSGKVFPLHGNQRLAVDPVESVWLSASAGTGKTQVLSARVLRLLLQPGVQPSQILCLTFTKAGAAEMAVRVNEVLANWVRMSETALASDLVAIGAENGPRPGPARARCLRPCSIVRAVGSGSIPFMPSPSGCWPRSPPKQGWPRAPGRWKTGSGECSPARFSPACCWMRSSVTIGKYCQLSKI